MTKKKRKLFNKSIKSNIKNSFGALDSIKSADQLIQEIRMSRISNRNIENLDASNLLEQCVHHAEKNGLSSMTMDDISKEVKAVRIKRT
jgi:hypothetical protein